MAKKTTAKMSTSKLILLVLLNLLLISITGGFWLLVLIVWAIIKILNDK